jgi:hypothetical protein
MAAMLYWPASQLRIAATRLPWSKLDAAVTVSPHSKTRRYK